MLHASSSKAPFLLGFDAIEQTVARATRAGSDGYPPYNIERIGEDAREAGRLRITLAVAGFTADQLEITVERGQLTIRGRHNNQSNEKARVYLHRGIAARQFQRVFHFAEAMRVAKASLDRGLLSVELIRPESERKAQKIEIEVRD